MKCWCSNSCRNGCEAPVKRRFRIGRAFRVPDGTLVASLFNLGGSLSVAAGIIPPRTSSRIHVIPFVSQLTFCVAADSWFA